MEVIYLGPYQTPEMVTKAAIEEDANIIGLSVLDGQYLLHAQQMLDALKAKNSQHIPVIMGGVIPRQDIPSLMEAGIEEIFLTGATISHIAGRIRSIVPGARREGSKGA